MIGIDTRFTVIATNVCESEKGRPESLPSRILPACFADFRYFPLTGMTSEHGASADLQGF